MGSYMNRYCRTWIGLTWEGPDMNRSFEICQIYKGHEWGQTWKGPDMNRSFWTWMRSDMNRAWHESLGHESVDMKRVDMNRAGLNRDNPVTLSYVGCVNSPNDTFTYVYVIHFDSDILTPFFGVTPRIFSSLPQGNSREVTWDASRHVSSVRALGEIWINVWHIFNPKTQSSLCILYCIEL